MNFSRTGLSSSLLWPAVVQAQGRRWTSNTRSRRLQFLPQECDLAFQVLVLGFQLGDEGHAAFVVGVPAP